jgi:RNase P subunit RPR2
MINLSKRTFCYYCQRELKEGEGRYRFFQQETEVECCPSCHDATRALPRLRCPEPVWKRSSCETESEI